VKRASDTCRAWRTNAIVCREANNRKLLFACSALLTGGMGGCRIHLWMVNKAMDKGLDNVSMVDIAMSCTRSAFQVFGMSEVLVGSCGGRCARHSSEVRFGDNVEAAQCSRDVQSHRRTAARFSMNTAITPYGEPLDGILALTELQL